MPRTNIEPLSYIEQFKRAEKQIELYEKLVREKSDVTDVYDELKSSDNTPLYDSGNNRLLTLHKTTPLYINIVRVLEDELTRLEAELSKVFSNEEGEPCNEKQSI
jgi:hypothetical protein